MPRRFRRDRRAPRPPPGRAVHRARALSLHQQLGCPGLLEPTYRWLPGSSLTPRGDCTDPLLPTPSVERRWTSPHVISPIRIPRAMTTPLGVAAISADACAAPRLSHADTTLPASRAEPGRRRNTA